MTSAKILQKLIGIKSTSDHEAEILAWVKLFLSKLGLDPFMVSTNLVALIKGKNCSSSIIFNAHLDTVSPGNETLWHNPPYVGKKVKGKVFGLGASDEKAAVASLLILAKKLIENQPQCDVWLTFVTHEELDGSGTKVFIDWFSNKYQKKYKEVAGILGEPTGLNKIEIAHKGNVFLKVTTIGNSGHGSTPKKIKKHAVLEMYKFAQKIEKLSKLWEKKYSDALLGKPTVGLLTSIQSGDINCPNKFPDTCVATFDIRTTPQLHDVATDEIKSLGGGIIVDLVYPPGLCGYTNKNAKIAKVLKKVSGAKFGISEGANDMCSFTQAGIPAVVFGPGELETIHKPNEYCEIGKVEKCARIYFDVINEFST